MIMDSGDIIFTIQELAEYLKISRSTLYKLAQNGKIPGQKVGRHWRFRKKGIDRWLEDNNSATSLIREE
jgi:excisionase family DNA binding protein